MDHLEYDRSLTIPVPAESVLMEAARMIDEWPMIERKIKGPRMIFRRTDAGRLYATASPAADDLDFDLDLFAGGEKPAKGQRKTPAPSPDEREILRLLDGKGTVQDVVDRSSLGEFDVHRLLYDFLQRELIEEVPDEKLPDSRGKAAPTVDVAGRAAVAAVAVLTALSIATSALNPLAPWKLGAASREGDRLRQYVSLGRLERLESAIQTHYLDTGTAPEHLGALVSGGYLRQDDLLDPWGRPFLYKLERDGYALGARNAAGEVEAGSTLAHRFTPSQRMILDGPAMLSPGEKRPRP
jgi:hypothetical protein